MSVSTGISTRAKRLLAVQTTQMFRNQLVPKVVEVFLYPPHGDEGKREKEDVLTANGYQAFPRQHVI